MNFLQRSRASFLLLVVTIAISSLFSIKGTIPGTSALKVEEVAILGKNHSTRSNVNRLDKKPEVSKRAQFVLCENCYWCVSLIRIEEKLFHDCPECHSRNLGTLPICLDEVYLFYCDERQGVSLTFGKEN